MLDRHGFLAGWVGGAAPELGALVLAGFGGAHGHGFAAVWAGSKIGRIGRIGLILVCFVALRDSGFSESLAVATAFYEGLLHGDEQIV